MQSDEMLDDGQTETGASRIPRTRPFHPIEPFEDPREIDGIMQLGWVGHHGLSGRGNIDLNAERLVVEKRHQLRLHTRQQGTP